MRKILTRKLQEVIGLLCHRQFECLNRSSSEMEIAILSIRGLKVCLSHSVNFLADSVGRFEDITQDNGSDYEKVFGTVFKGKAVALNYSSLIEVVLMPYLFSKTLYFSWLYLM